MKARAQLGNFTKCKTHAENSTTLSEQIPAEKNVFTALASRMVVSLKQNDLPKFKLQATELNTRLANFALAYLQ